MNTSDINRIVTALRDKLERTNTSANNAATQMGVSGALLSNMLNGKHDKISDRMWRTIGAWAGVETTQWHIRETANLTSICAMCQDAKDNNRLLAVSDRTGLGKTTALEYYAGQHANTWYVLCTVTMTRKDFLAAIMQAMGIMGDGSIHQRTTAIIHRLMETESPLLILDDAVKLSDPCIRLIQVIRDGSKNRAGIVIAGPENLYTRIHTGAQRDRYGYRELRRRIGYWHKLQPIGRQWLKAVCADYGITDQRATTLVGRMADDYGTLRELLTNWERADREGRDPVEVLSELHVGTPQHAQL